MHSMSGGEVPPAKQFHTDAARVIMKVMYAARMARPDLIRTISFLARYLTKWSEEMDKGLHRLMSYIHYSYAYRMFAWAGTVVDNFTLDVYSDSDYAGCSETQRSIIGSIVFSAWYQYVRSNFVYIETIEFGLSF